MAVSPGTFALGPATVRTSSQSSQVITSRPEIILTRSTTQHASTENKEMFRMMGASAAFMTALGASAARRQMPSRGDVSQAAKTKTKKKKGGAKNDAVLRAMQAMETLQQIDKVDQQAPAKKKKGRKERGTAATSLADTTEGVVEKTDEEAGKVEEEEKARRAEETKAEETRKAEAEARKIEADQEEEAQKAEQATREAEAAQKEEAQRKEEEAKLAEAAKEEEVRPTQDKERRTEEQAAATAEDVVSSFAETDEAETPEEAAAKSPEEKTEASPTILKAASTEKKKGPDPFASLLDACFEDPASKATPKKNASPKSGLDGALAALGDFATSQDEEQVTRSTSRNSPLPGIDQMYQQSADPYGGFDRISEIRARTTVEKESEWSDSESESEEEEEYEEPIKRKRGKVDAVSFELEKGEATGTVAVGIKGVAVTLGGRTILQDASWMVKTGEKLALVGANGCGKTTQLRVLTGELEPDEGEVYKNQDSIRMAILEQGFVDALDPENTLKQELLSAVPTQSNIKAELEQVEAALEGNPPPEEQDKLVTRLMELQTEAEQNDIYSLDRRLAAISEQVGFLPEDLELKVGLFSGGWKVRIGLSKIFMTNPDVLLLDEPTNHLDMDSVSWLEGFLKKQTLPIVVVTHDREFMNQICDRCIETVEGMTYSYKGTYANYVEQRNTKMEKWADDYKKQVKKVAELKDYIKKNKMNHMLASVRNKKSRELENMQSSEDFLDPPPQFAKRIKFRFPEPPKDRRGGRKLDILAQMRNVTHGYGDGVDSQLLNEADFMVQPGEKIGIVGKNGTGKSTLLRLLAGTEAPSGGGTIRAADEASTAYFAQHQADLLPMGKTAFQVVKDANEILMSDEDLKEILKKFRFKGDRLNTLIDSLSGGEKARLAIVRMMLRSSRMLIFDEPTNHLDVPMKETLEYALREFQGAVVIVSHDRWFLSQTCTKIVEIKDGAVKTYNGDFRFYMDCNPETSKTIQRKYTGLEGGIRSVPLAGEARRKKERKGLKKYANQRRRDDRLQSKQDQLLSSRY